MSGTNSILFVDAYDSFSNNIIALLYECVPSAEVVVVHIDTDIRRRFGIGLEAFIQSFQAVVLGPGPGHPANQKDVGLFEDVWEVAERFKIPVLGICLGFQSLCLRNGYPVTRMHMPCHGQTKAIRTSNVDVFEHVEAIFAMNYNSLAVRKTNFAPERQHSRPSSSGTDSSSSSTASDFVAINPYPHIKRGSLQLLAWDDDGYVMAVRHPLLPLWGFQFHPESCMSRHCLDLMKNWWLKVESHNHLCRPPQPPQSKFLHQVDDKISRSGVHDARAPKSEVSWQMFKAKNLDSSAIADLCYKASNQSATVMLESTAKGRFSIYAFTDYTSEKITFLDGLITSSSAGKVSLYSDYSSEEALRLVENRTKLSSCQGGCPGIPFWGGYIGYLSYEIGLDTINVASKRSRKVPDLSLVFVERSVVFDHRTNDICIQSIRSGDDAWVKDMKATIKKLDTHLTRSESTVEKSQLAPIFQSCEMVLPDHQNYTSLIRQCQENLHAGQSYELCLTGEATVDTVNDNPDSSYLLYKNLRKHNPVPYASYLHFPDAPRSPKSGTTVLSSSPELFLSQTRTGTMDMIPMKGTVQRTSTTTIDDAMKILYTPKETAENLMIADLIRHDLYSVVGSKPYPYFTQSPNPASKAQYDESTRRPELLSQEDKEHDELPASESNSTRSPLSIPSLNAIQTYETVYQLTSHIRAHPPPRLSLPSSSTEDVISHNHSALRHVLPPGSMTGAPKKRSCEILETLETRNRGVYSGVIGYMDVGGGSCWSVAIRTAFSVESEDYEVPATQHEVGPDHEKTQNGDVNQDENNEWEQVQMQKRRIWHVGAGGAITVLSDVEAEWQEMMGKLKNVLRGFRE